MRPIAICVARSVDRVAVCFWAHRRAVQKQLNRSRCHLGADWCGSKETCIRWGVGVQMPTRKGALWRGGHMPATVTYLTYLCRMRLPSALGRRMTPQGVTWQDGVAASCQMTLSTWFCLCNIGVKRAFPMHIAHSPFTHTTYSTQLCGC